MKNLGYLSDSQSTHMHRYVITSHNGLADAIGDAIVKEDLSVGCCVNGKLDAPTEYPYIAILHADQEYDMLDVTFITKTDMELFNA